jgi:hypothetical protein
MTGVTSDPFEFAGKLLGLLQYGGFTSTYKYAVLLGLLDLCVEFNTRGGAPTVVTTNQLAHKVIELYWPQTWPFKPSPRARGDVLYQNTGRAHVEVVAKICAWRTRHAPAGESLARARVANHEAFSKLVRAVEWKLVQMPLPRLQRVGDYVDPFIYSIGWNEQIKKGEFNSPSSFDNRISLEPEAAHNMVRIAPLLRPLIHREWAAMVARINRLEIHQLEVFLFAPDEQINLAPIRAQLLELQSCRCFYCAGMIKSDAQVDHFIPRARHPDHGIENLVVAHQRCNGSKNDFLAHTDHLLAWANRLDESGSDLATIASEAEWDRHPGRTINVVRTVYEQLADDAALWRTRGTKASHWPIQPADRKQAFALMAAARAR